MKKQYKISVAVITYNQQDTIGQTLDSILMQQGDFDLEVVIGEDCSTDTTYAICEKYARQWNDEMSRTKVLNGPHALNDGPGKRIVKLLPNTHNLGIMANFARVMLACKGDYVGICAGDDYWCDNNKLQKQLDYFILHQDIGVVSTAGYKLMVKSNKLVPNAVAPINPIHDGNVKPFYFSADYKGGVYAMPLTLLIRRALLKHIDFEEFIRRGFPVEDYPMQAILSQYTRWGHITDLCVVYRVYKESTTFIELDNPKYLQYHKGLMNVRRYLNGLFPNDACFSETQLQEYEFYKEFLLYLHQFDYAKAKLLIANVQDTIANSSKVCLARRYTSSKLHFILFHFYKEYSYHKDIKKRT